MLILIALIKFFSYETIRFWKHKVVHKMKTKIYHKKNSKKMSCWNALNLKLFEIFYSKIYTTIIKVIIILYEKLKLVFFSTSWEISHQRVLLPGWAGSSRISTSCQKIFFCSKRHATKINCSLRTLGTQTNFTGINLNILAFTWKNSIICRI